MARMNRSANGQSKSNQTKPAKGRPRLVSSKAQPAARTVAEPQRLGAQREGWATDLVFDVREPKLAVSLRLDADVLRFFRGFGAGYQTRINEVLKAFMQARGGAESIGHHALVGSRASRASASNGKRASR